MMRFKNFLKTTLIGGVAVILPLLIIFAVISFSFNFIKVYIEPLTSILVEKTGLPIFVSDILMMGLFIVICFFIGLFAKTKIGQYIENTIEKRILKKIPGYKLIKETVKQFTGAEENPFGSVALADIFNTGVLVTVFISDKNPDLNFTTVFLPTGPNPTSGNIYHVPKEKVYKIDINIEIAMKSIISCGVGSRHLIEIYEKEYKNKGKK